MSDEVFHLTPVDVRRREFKTALRGYEKLDVDQFREQVADELERLTRVNQELDAKAKALFEQLKSFRERDKALNEALISAQQLRAETREQAEREAQLILREARAEAERMAEATKGELRGLGEQIAVLDRTRRAYFAQLRMLVERQLADIQAAEAAMPPLQAPQTQAPNGGDGARQARSQTPAWLDSLLKE
jgi:DivIVA domain-containing protein